MGKELALFCTLHAATPSKRDRILSLLHESKHYYTTPTSLCTTWSYFTPSTTLSVASDLVRPAARDLTIAGLEIYSDKSALSIQTASPMFEAFHATVRDEELYARDEELVVWYPAGGFVGRGGLAGPFGGGVLVLMGLHVVKEGTREEFVRVLSEYADWVKRNEPGFLTYLLLTRPKAPDEVLVFERCVGKDAFEKHASTSEFRRALKAVMPFMKVPKGQEWTELDNAFVGDVVGGGVSAGSSKL